MNRRSFFRRFAGAIAAVAVAQGVVRSWAKLVTFSAAPALTTIRYVFDGEKMFRQDAPLPSATNPAWHDADVSEIKVEWSVKEARPAAP